jgi:hypothetical protein
MLNIQFDDPELENSIRQVYGDNTQTIARAFAAFIQQEQLKDDIRISVQQLENGEAIPLRAVMQDLRARYE